MMAADGHCEEQDSSHSDREHKGHTGHCEKCGDEAI
jgi:hypothetical protein